MHERLLPASPNWYCSRSSDTSRNGIFGFGAKNTIYLLDITVSSPAIVGELNGHKERVSGLAFCRHPGQDHLCASTSDDGTVKIWDINDKAVLKEHRSHQGTITALHWSPVEKDLVVSGDEKGIVACYWLNRDDTQTLFPEPRNIFCLTCSPHNGKHIAVGYKDGMVIVMDISRKVEVLHRLRGHDDEIHALAWCPQPGEDPLFGRAEETPEVTNGVAEGAEKGCYLASGSKDQTVRIWSTARGRGVTTLKLPFLKRRGVGVDPSVKERLWLTVHWPKGWPSQVVSSCFGGELVQWDLTKTGKQKWSLLGSSSDGQNHSRIVFNMSSVGLGGRELLLSTSMDREIKCWDLSSLECCWTLPTLGGFVYSLAFSPVGTGCLALGVGDNMIRVWGTLSLQNRYETRAFWQGIRSKVTALSWHPTKEGSLAFGTDDGKVGIYEAYSNKSPQISSTYHRKTVYTVAWGPPVPPMAFGGGDKPSIGLYSCGGEGLILQHDPWKLAGEASDIDELIRDTNNIKHKLSPHTDFCWKPDGKVLAIGNEDGSIEVYHAPDLRQLCSIQQHHKIINVLRWHHQLGSQHLRHLLASGSSNAVIYVHDLSGPTESPPESPVLITEAFRSLAGHTAKITDLAWSPHHDGRLVTVCYDGTAQVWDVLKDEALCNYRGHRGRLLCVQWSPVDPDLVWTGGDDFTAQEWAVSKQEHSKPPRGKKGVELEKKRSQQQKAYAKKKKAAAKAAGKGGVRAGEGKPLNGEGEREVERERGVSDNEEEEEEGETDGTPPPTARSKESSRPADRVVAERVPQEGKTFGNEGKKEMKEERRREKPEIPGKKRKPRSILPLSTSMDHRSKEDLQQDCLCLAEVRFSQGPRACVPGVGEHIQLGLFSDRDALYRMFQEEGRSHEEGGHYECAVYLSLWRGDITGALQAATQRGELTDHLVSIAPMAGYGVWLRTVEAFVKQLCFQEQFLKAASYLLSIHRVYEAVDLLKSQQLYREAIALAKARLQPDDPALTELYSTWASVLERDGHYATAAKCYLATDCAFDAAKVIAKKGDVLSLKTAGRLAAMAGEKELAHSLSLRCAKELAAAADWLGAQEALRTQESLLGFRVMLYTNELLSMRLETGVTKRSCSTSHSWSELGGQDFLCALKAVLQREMGVSENDPERVRSVRQQLQALDSPTDAPNIPTNQVLQCVSQDVTMGLLSCLLGDWGAGLEEVLRGVARCRGAGHFSLLSDTCRLLFPEGPDSVAQYRERLQPQDERGVAAADSLVAWVCYTHLYQHWWSQSADIPDTHHPSASDTHNPSASDTHNPSASDTHNPSASDTHHPSASDTHNPSASDTHNPSASVEPDMQTDTETVVMAGSETVVMARSDTETVVMAGSDTETVVMARSETVVMAGSDTETVVMAGSETETVVMARSETVVMARSDTETVVMAGSDTETVVMAGSETVVMAGSETVVMAGSDTETVVMAGSDTETVVMAGSETVVMAGSDTETVVMAGSETVVMAGSDTETVVMARSDTETVVMAGSDTETVVMAGSDTETVVMAGSDTETVVMAGSDTETAVLSGFGRALLSEPHASLQATQRAVEEVQQQISSLVQQHRLTQTAGDGHTDTHSSTDPQRDANSSLPSLIALVSERHKELAGTPEHIKKYPFPDVLECCLVFLHMDRNSTSVPKLLKEEALGLLQKHGTTASHSKACQKFLN
ncbi:gem-associated protein 5 isoform X4 [Conger conger]|uniref:gem-associated protein 5 isoform X4 n=1 Tax=Conger conger TaxID=82655 RepID=UPI002A5A154F|nr:gem-associated protein 5 isoform X4 [Conger conger]